MPLKVRGLLFSFFTATVCGTTLLAQQPITEPSPILASNTNVAAAPSIPAPAPTMPERINRIRAMIAARVLGPAAIELEKIKREYSDEALQSVVRVMLVNIYLEQPDYLRVSALLDETLTRSKNRKTGTENIYIPVAGQVIKGAEEQLNRYKKLGFNISDPKLPVEAAGDLDKWRKMLEKITEQAREMSKDEKKAVESLAILEEAANARKLLARDEYEASSWRNAMEDTRELIAASQSKVTDVDSGGAVEMKNVAELKLPIESNNAQAVANKPVEPTSTAINSETFKAVKANSEEPKVQPKPETVASAQPNQTPVEPPTKTLSIFNPSNEERIAGPQEENAEENNSLMRLGSLAEMATRKFPPTYPPLARNARVSGVVKVELTVDEKGEVADAKATDGPEMLRRAAMEAVKRWKFKPAVKDGQPVKMSGFVNFNFTL